MTREQLLQIVLSQARSRGFEFRRWFTRYTGRPWVTAEDALTWLSVGRRHYMLLFSHEFACTFWKSGEPITFTVPAQEFQRILPDGTTTTVQRKAYIRRASRPDTWKYHLREMANTEEPLRYIRRYLMVEDDLEPEDSVSPQRSA